MEILEKIDFRCVFFIWCLFLSFSLVFGVIGLFISLKLTIFCGLIIVILAIFWMPITLSNIKSKQMIEDYLINHRENDQYLEPYHSVIIANSTTAYKRLGIFTGIDLIVERLERESCPYKIVLCNNPNEAKSEIEEPNAKFIYLFGHGFRGGLTFYQTNSVSELEYKDVNRSSKKEFIAQFHCNSGNESSLIDILLKDTKNEENYYFREGYQPVFNLWYDIRFKVLKKIKEC